MALTLEHSGAGTCDWLYQPVNGEGGLPVPAPLMTQAHFALLTSGRLKTFLTSKYVADGEKDAAQVFTEAAARAGLQARINQNVSGVSVFFALDADGYPNAIWYWRGEWDFEPPNIHISLPYSASE